MHFDPRDHSLADSHTGRQKLVRALMATSLDTKAIGAHTVDPSTLPRRYLPPGCYSDLFRLYLAECHAASKPAASPSTFFRTLRQSGWNKKIKFRGVSTHAQCEVCHRLKSAIRNAKSIQVHAQRADEYQRHLSGVYADRQVYAQTKQRAATQKDILCLIADSMDRSKFRLPKFAMGRTPKPLETRKRPEMELTCVICHSIGIYIFLTDSEQSTGSDWSLEVLSLALDSAFDQCQRDGRSWPQHLKMWTNNTPKAT